MPSPFTGTPGRHLGLLFAFRLSPSTNNFKVLEHMTVEQATGFFEQGVSVAQQKPCPVDEKNLGYDFIGQSSDEIVGASNVVVSPSSGGANELAGAGSPVEGTYLAKQYFSVIIDEKVLVVKNSGFALHRTLKDGKLTIQRVPAKVGPAEPGACGGEAGQAKEFAML